MICPSTSHLSVLCSEIFRRRNDVVWAGKSVLFGLWWELSV